MKGIKTSSQMGWFRDSVTVEIIYIDRLLRGDPEKDKLMDELNFRYCMRFKRKKTSKFLLVLQSRE